MFFNVVIAEEYRTNAEFVEDLREKGVTVYESEAKEHRPVSEVTTFGIPTRPSSNNQAILPQNAVVTDFDFSTTSGKLYSEYVFTPNTSVTSMNIRMTTGQSASGVFNVKVYRADTETVVATYPSLTIEPASSGATTKTVSSSIFQYGKGYYIEVTHISGGTYLSMVVS